VYETPDGLSHLSGGSRRAAGSPLVVGNFAARPT